MNKLVGSILALGLTLSSAGAAPLGPGGTGGGNGYGSSPDEVKRHVDDIAQLLVFFFVHDEASRQDGALLNPTSVTDPDTRSVLEAWTQDRAALEKDLESSQHVPQDAACSGGADEGGTDASTELHLGAPICISTGRLSRFPVWALDPELFALLGHETAHHYGFSETAARAIQGYLYKNYGAIQTQFSIRLITEQMSDILKTADDRQIANRDAYWDSNFPAQCLFIYKMLGVASVYEGAQPRSDAYTNARGELESDCLLTGRASKAMFVATLKNLQLYEQAVLNLAKP